MQDGTIYLKRIMDTYYKVTETGSFCFDTRLNPVLSHPELIPLHEFTCLGFNKLLSFLAETFSSTVSDNKYYAYFLHNNIVCHVVFLTDNNNYIGAIVTEPILVKSLTDAELNALASQNRIPNLTYTDLHKILLKKKIVAYDKAMTYGTVLYSLCTSLFKENAGLQILKSYPNTTKKTASLPVDDGPVWNVKGIERHIPSSTYLSIKRAIQEGDTKKIIHIINQQSASNAPMYQLHNTDHIRSIKNSFIKLCSMVCYTAIDAGAPYVQTLDMSDDMILKMELTDNITELYEMMKNTLIELTRAVSDSKKSIYSQPVRKILDYLYSHYSEKITLEDLSNITRLSTYYISNLIKTETGLSLNDNINKIRIEQSQKMLLEKNASILEVAQSVGFRYQNHFAAVFKKYSGITPSDYRNAHGISLSGNYPQLDMPIGEIISQATQQAKSKLAIFNGLYDTARIVDPVEHTSWFIYENDTPQPELNCYNFWNKNESCQNCVSMRAYVQNDTFFKLEQKNGQTYLVLAFPEGIGKSTYITEIIKDISNQSIINISPGGQNSAIITADSFKDAQTGFYTRYYIDKHLPEEIRKSRIEQTQLSLIAAVITLPEKTADTYEAASLIADSDQVCLEASLKACLDTCLTSPDDWIGHYAGNILLFVLHNSTEEQIIDISHTIQNKLSERLNTLGYKDISVHTAEQSLNQEPLETGEMLYLLIAKLYAKAQSDT